MNPLDAIEYLLSSAIGHKDVTASFFLDADWQTVIELANRQGVGAIAADGLQRLLDAHPDLELTLDLPENEQLKYDWLGQTFAYEMDFARQFKLANRLAELFANSGLKTVVLKGFAIGQFYPIPEHRPCGDLDCFLLDADGIEGDPYERGNLAVEASGVPVSRAYYKNSSFDYRGLHVENHRFCSPVRGPKSRKRYERKLRELMCEKLTPIRDSALWAPSPMFNLLFLTSHAQGHFLADSGLSLRHICDWGMTLKAYANEVDWSEFKGLCREFKLEAFADAMSRAAHLVCGVEIPYPCPKNDKADDCLMNGVLNGAIPTGRKRFWARLNMVSRILRSSKRYRLFSNRPMLVSLFQSVWYYIFEKRPTLE